MTTISIICPTFNEESHIERTLQSFLNQKRDSFDLEILIVDGMSEDKTRSIVKEFEQKYLSIRLIDNKETKTPFAFNEGLKNAKGEYVAILGAHTYYAPNYLQVCYDELLRTESAGCTGRIISSNPSDKIGAKYAQWIMENSFGVSGSSFRTIKEGYTHSVNFAVFNKSVLLALGGYDTTMHRNQDNDMNQRICDAGYKLYCTWKTECHYYTSSSLVKLFKYAKNNGYWNAISLIHRTRSMRLYHFVPFLFLLTLLGGFVLGGIEFFFWHKYYILLLTCITLIIHLLTGALFTVLSAFKVFDFRKSALPILFLIFHLSYGWGTLTGIGDLLINKDHQWK
jgi:succinoglycan biosynthesis protein ExoA